MELSVVKYRTVCSSLLKDKINQKINSLISCLDHKLKTNKTLIAIELHWMNLFQVWKLLQKWRVKLPLAWWKNHFVLVFLWDTFVTTNTLIGKKPLVDCTGSLFYRSNSAGAHFRSWQFTSSFPLGNLFSFRNSDNVLGKISVHIFAPTEGWCLWSKMVVVIHLCR